MKRFLLVVLCLLAFPIVASHIVGGEFEIIHISGSTYRVNLILYFDVDNGNSGARDNDVTARIFRKRDNAVMRDVFLPRLNEVSVPYTQPECSVGGVKTSKITYSTTIQMPAKDYGDPEGYYIVWERCCRNYNENNLRNIVSVNPETGNQQDAAGQTFFLQFPPVVKNGQPFINSSPQLFPPLSDYACMGKPYYTDFAGSDLDGDSLVYSLVTPLNTHTATALPPNGPGPQPFREVKWLPPYGPGNIMGGTPDLKINRDGLLTVTPGNVQGLFVFAVKCEEFRQGVKIGELRRDFQMYVLECEASEPPQITGRPLGGTAFSSNELSVTFDETATDETRCVEVQITDPDVLRAPQFQEKIKIRVVPLDFKKSAEQKLPATVSGILTKDNGAQSFKICFDKCPYRANGHYKVGIVVGDDACSLPLLDTLKVNVYVKPPDNGPAKFTKPTADITATILEQKNGTMTWEIEGYDPDGDELTATMVGFGFSPSQAGFTLEEIENENGHYKGKLTWDIDCEHNNKIFASRKDFELSLALDDKDECNITNPDILNFRLHIKLDNNQAPIISTNLTARELEQGINRTVFESLTFKINGTDPDKDNLVLTGFGEGFNLNTYSMSFPAASGLGNVSSNFNWNISCNNVNLALKREFQLVFVAIDQSNRCGIYQADSLSVRVKVSPPANTAPFLHVANLVSEIPFVNHTQEVIRGQEISLAFTATDPNTAPEDLVKIELAEATGNVEPTGYFFTPGEGLGSAQASFNWTPDCTVFKDGVYHNDYNFKFVAYDNRCQNVKGDTIDIKLVVKDIEANHTEFLPPNIITPNGDGCNDYFGMEELESTPCGEIREPKLPLDNCAGQFTSIRIYNRWGKEVFFSTHRNFRWFAYNEAVGVYYYSLKYSHKEYKGSLTVSY